MSEQKMKEGLIYVQAYIEEADHWENREPLLGDIERFLAVNPDHDLVAKIAKAMRDTSEWHNVTAKVRMFSGEIVCDNMQVTPAGEQAGLTDVEIADLKRVHMVLNHPRKFGRIWAHYHKDTIPPLLDILHGVIAAHEAKKGGAA